MNVQNCSMVRGNKPKPMMVRQIIDESRWPFVYIEVGKGNPNPRSWVPSVTVSLCLQFRVLVSTVIRSEVTRTH